jgi:hypothetical protein
MQVHIMKIKNRTIIATAILIAMQGCATTSEDVSVQEADLTKTLPPAAAGITSEPHYFSSAQKAANALSGYNYGLVNLPDGRVQAFVSGLVGSGSGNAIAPVAVSGQSSSTLLADLDRKGEETPFPEIRLSKKMNGQAAIEALGDKLEEVAASYKMSTERLQEILQTDNTAWIDETGHLLYIEMHTERPPDEVQEATATVEGSSKFSTIAATSEPFALHSKPGSNRLIYLDFNGHIVTSSAWNSGTLTAQPYDVDGNPAAFSDTELNNIKEIWQRVAEDFAPFDVNVTTEEPSTSALQRISSSDVEYGTRAVITRSMPQLCRQSCGGVAYVNVFSYFSSTAPERYQPAWVFFDKLGNGYPKYVAEALSHEVGHNLNLNHDGNTATVYYAGHGSGATGWAPIMGVGYYKSVTQWSKGEYPGANNLQDDITVIHAAGAPLRPDDFANTIANASPLGGSANAVNQTGVIERIADVDVFTFSTGGGSVRFSVTQDSPGANLDVLLKLLDARGKVIAEAGPLDSLSASLSLSLTAGQYFLQIEGVGKGDLATGYSDYGSVGQYQITGSFKPGSAFVSPSATLSALPASGEVPLSVTFDGSKSTDNDGSITGYNWNFGDGFTQIGNATMSHVYKTPGTYTASLTVTDNSGLTATATQTLQVTQAPVSSNLKSGRTEISRKILGARSQCVANVLVNNANEPVKGAIVHGYWSGSARAGKKQLNFSALKRAVTGKRGLARFVSSRVPKKSEGTCAFTVTNIVKQGYEYEGSGNVADSFTW